MAVAAAMEVFLLFVSSRMSVCPSCSCAGTAAWSLYRTARSAAETAPRRRRGAFFDLLGSYVQQLAGYPERGVFPIQDGGLKIKVSMLFIGTGVHEYPRHWQATCFLCGDNFGAIYRLAAKYLPNTYYFSRQWKRGRIVIDLGEISRTAVCVSAR